MSTKSKTLYDILGVTQNSTEKELKQAYRKLAKELHPDINKEDDAQEKFHALKEAFEILTNPELKAKYDDQLSKNNPDLFRYDKAFDELLNVFFSNKRSGTIPVDGKDIQVTLELNVENILRQYDGSVRLKKSRNCTKCEGTGTVTSKASCKVCSGIGGKTVETRTPFGKIDTFKRCKQCEGTGKENPIPCQTCTGTGGIAKDEEIVFQLPMNAIFGDVIRIKGKGDEGRNGGRDGDVLITLKQSMYDKLEVDYDVDVTETRHVGLQEILEGQEYALVFPDGTSEKFTLSDKLSGSNQLTFPEKGLFDKSGKRGLYNLKFIVDYPKLNKQQRDKILSVLGRDA